MENPLNGMVGFAVGGLDFGGGFEFRMRWRVEQTIGEGTADAFVKQDEQERSLVAFGVVDRSSACRRVPSGRELSFCEGRSAVG